jgi:hypothetical protein
MYVFTPNQIVEIFPYSIGALRRDNPNTSFPRNPSDAVLADWNVFPVVEQSPPEYNPANQNLNQLNPTLVDGEWLQTWQVTAASAEEIAERLQNKEAEVRQQRNELLSACDWTQLPDSPADHEAWATYRQELRDVTAQEGFPWNVTWPEEPQDG